MARRRTRRPGPAHQPATTPRPAHTYAFALAEATGSDAYELERRLGHQSQRYISRYTNPPEDIAAGYVENLQLALDAIGAMPATRRAGIDHVGPFRGLLPQDDYERTVIKIRNFYGHTAVLPRQASDKATS